YFPLVWARTAKVPGENVTDRYARGQTKPPAERRLAVEVHRGADRVEAEITTLDRTTGAGRALGKSPGPQVDINRRLTCEAPVAGTALVVARYQGHAAIRAVKVASAGDTAVRVDIDGPLTDETRVELGHILTERFGADSAKRDAASKLLGDMPWDSA